MLVGPEGGARSARSFELDLAFELHRQLERRDLKGNLGRKRLVSLDRPRLTCGGDRLLDGALRTHANQLEKLADREVEGVFVHVLNSVPSVLEGSLRVGASQSAARVLRTRATSVRVELSSPVDASPASPGTRAFAITLPSSTPH